VPQQHATKAALQLPRARVILWEACLLHWLQSQPAVCRGWGLGRRDCWLKVEHTSQQVSCCLALLLLLLLLLLRRLEPAGAAWWHRSSRRRHARLLRRRAWLLLVLLPLQRPWLRAAVVPALPGPCLL
jgi:hypothetical protein